MRFNKDYIESIEHKDADKLPAVPGAKFTKALEATYGTEQVKKAVSWLFTPNTNASYAKGLEQFQKRYLDSFDQGWALSGADQKYLASVVHGVAIGRFNPDQGNGGSSAVEAPIKSI
jgi:hypothetical protein